MGGEGAVGGSSQRNSTNVGGFTAAGGATLDAGDPGDFCEGSVGKVQFNGKVVAAPATQFVSPYVLDCCMAYGVNLHTRADFGFDVGLNLISGRSLDSVGQYPLSAVPLSSPHRVLASPSNQPAPFSSASAVVGELQVFAVASTSSPGEIGICAQVPSDSESLAGARLYVPRIPLANYDAYKGWQLYLLGDATITPDQAAAMPLESLPLAVGAALSLSSIAYFQRSTGEVGFIPSTSHGDALKSALNVPLAGLPFVVVVDGERMYLGAFTRAMSSYAPPGPTISVDAINNEYFTIEAPRTGNDPRFSPRVVEVLQKAVRLIP